MFEVDFVSRIGLGSWPMRGRALPIYFHTTPLTRSRTIQTFLPEPIFSETAKLLDRQRLGKQRVETLQIAKVLAGQSDGWANHPAVKMWRGHDQALLAYQYAICTEWTINRGYQDTCLLKTANILGLPILHQKDPEVWDNHPWWHGWWALHDSHKSNLLRKMPDHYRKFWPEFRDDMPYWWPDANDERYEWPEWPEGDLRWKQLTT